MTDATGKRVVILGAASAIAQAAARIWAAAGGSFVLAGRHRDHLEAVAADLRVRGAARADIVVLDLATADAAAEFARMSERLGSVDGVLLAYGLLGDQAEAEADPAVARNILHTDFTSAAGWCLAAAERLASQRHGTLIVLGSVAGDRGRRSNYVYGAAKGGLGILCQGIAHRLAPTGARAVLVKPGFVDTPMTAHLAARGLLWSKPDAVGAAIVRAAQRGGPIVYAPRWWRAVMLLIRAAPSKLFHQTRL